MLVLLVYYLKIYYTSSTLPKLFEKKTHAVGYGGWRRGSLGPVDTCQGDFAMRLLLFNLKNSIPKASRAVAIFNPLLHGRYYKQILHILEILEILGILETQYCDVIWSCLNQTNF